jgi:hypothetical protein
MASCYHTSETTTTAAGALAVCGGGALAEPLLERVMQQLLTTLGDRAANASQVPAPEQIFPCRIFPRRFFRADYSVQIFPPRLFRADFSVQMIFC